MIHLGYIIQVLERRNYKEEKLRYKGPNVLMPFEERPRTCILVDNCGYAHFSTLMMFVSLLEVG